MGRIKDIVVDKPGSRKDLVVGSDFDNFGVTRNYGLGGIADVINRASGKSVFIYKYTETLSELDTKNAVMSSVNGDLDSATVTLKLSSPSIDTSMLQPLLIMTLSFSLIGIIIAILRIKAEILIRKKYL